MITGLRIFLFLLSGLLIIRDIGTALQPASIEITEEHSTTQKEEPGNVERKSHINVVDCHQGIIILLPALAKPVNRALLPITRTTTRWLLYCVLLI